METKDVVAYLTEYRKQLFDRREKFLRPLQEIDEDIMHITATLQSIQKSPAKATPPNDFLALSPDFPFAKLRNLTQVQALVVIAKHNNGIVRAQEAKRILIRAGIMRETKNSTNIIHSVIIRSEKFIKVRPGEYKLKDEGRGSGELAKLSLNSELPLPLSKPV